MPPSLALALSLLATAAPPDEPAITVRLERPDAQLERLIALFRGSRATDPAAAMAAWKRATKGTRGLGKAAEAAVAALNPRMVPELATLDASAFVLDFAAEDGRPSWSFSVPRDDGTLAAFATAMALTDGASEPPIEGTPIDRLGPPGSALMARPGESIVIGSSRDALPRALERLPALRQERQDRAARAKGGGEPGSTSRFEVDARGLARSRSLAARRLGEGMLGLDCRGVDGRLGLDHGRVSLTMAWRSDVPGTDLKLDPDWTRDLPATATIAFSSALDADPAAWDRLFAAADRVEKADPSRAGLNPPRVRLNLLARAAWLDPERDLWPKLRGVSGFLLGDLRNPVGAGLALHAKDAESAARLRAEFLPALAAALRLDKPQKPPDATPSALALATIEGRPLFVMKGEGPTVWIAWGQRAYSDLSRARLGPGFAIEGTDTLRVEPGGSRKIWIWPQRLGLIPDGSPLAEAIAPSPPICWSGESRRDGRSDILYWTGPRDAIRRFLGSIPQEPAPDPGR